MTKILVRTFIDSALRTEFSEQFPGTGSISWLLETSMRELLELTRGQPPLKDTVKGLIRSSVLRERHSNRVAKDARSKRQRPTVSVEPINTDSAEIL